MRYVRVNELPSFDDEWKKKEKQGYLYGRDALEQVRFGYEIAMAAITLPIITPKSSESMASFRYELVAHSGYICESFNPEITVEQYGRIVAILNEPKG